MNMNSTFCWYDECFFEINVYLIVVKPVLILNVVYFENLRCQQINTFLVFDEASECNW